MQIDLGNFQTMEPIKREDAFESDDFIYQLKWDGLCIRLSGLKEEISYAEWRNFRYY